MSVCLDLFFNTVENSQLKEVNEKNIDVYLSHNLENDMGINFEDYSCQLSVYKLLPCYVDSQVKEFDEILTKINQEIDYGSNPIIVFDIQRIVGQIDKNKNLRLTKVHNKLLGENKSYDAIMNLLINFFS